jgi:hypothetical protein
VNTSGSFSASSDFGVCVAASGEVVLVGLIDELHDARATGGVEGLEGDGHVQRGEVGVDAADLLLQAEAAGVVLVEAGAAEVLVGEGDGLEVAGGGERSGVVGGLLGSSGTATCGKKFADEAALAGLSSRKTMASRPSESSSAMA